jgi:hypothetical protein
MPVRALWECGGRLPEHRDQPDGFNTPRFLLRCWACRRWLCTDSVFPELVLRCGCGAPVQPPEWLDSLGALEYKARRNALPDEEGRCPQPTS